VTEVQETKGLSDSGDVIAASSWSPGDDLEVWYRDAGANILLVTRSTGRVLIHVDVNRTGIPDSGQDRVYAFGPDLSIHAQYTRPVWATAAWDALKTSASVEIRNRAGSSNFTLWRLPKEELGPLQDGADLTFEVFDERYQTSEFRPGIPFDAVVQLRYSKSSGKGVTKQEVPKGNGAGQLVVGVDGVPKKNRPGDGLGKGTQSRVGKTVMDEARQAEEKARQEREGAREQEMERQRQELASLKAQQEQQQRQIEEARQKLANEQEQRERDQKARDDARPKVFRPDPSPAPVPERPQGVYRGPTSGEIVWDGNIKGTELITIENGQASSGTVSGALPGVLCLLQPADPKRVSIASTPAPHNQYKRMVFRVSGNGRTRVVIRWSLP